MKYIPYLACILLAACSAQRDHALAKFRKDAPQTLQEGSIPEETPDPKKQRLDPYRRTYLILQVDGGGIMGTTPAFVLKKIEEALRKRNDSAKELNKAFDVCVGTSTGSIIAGMCAAGVSGETIASYYQNQGYDLFTHSAKVPIPIWPLFKFRYRRDLFQETLFQVLHNTPHGSRATLEQMYGGPLLIIPAFDLRSNRTHFFRTRDQGSKPLTFNGSTQLVDAISASAFSAPLFFGKLPAPDVVWDYRQADGSTGKKVGAVYNDGGQGTQNSAISIGMLEGVLGGWSHNIDKSDQVVMISLGCGNDYALRSFEKAKRMSATKQATQFLLGNQARGESTLMQWALADMLASRTKNFHFFRFDWVPDKKRDGTSTSAFSVNAKQRDLYIAQAEKIAQRPDFIQLMKDLQRVPLAHSQLAPKPHPGHTAGPKPPQVHPLVPEHPSQKLLSIPSNAPSL